MSYSKNINSLTDKKYLYDDKWLLSEEDRIYLQDNKELIRNIKQKEKEINVDFCSKTKDISTAKYIMFTAKNKTKILLSDKDNLYVGRAKIGQGASSIVWLMQSLDTGNWYAVKYYRCANDKQLLDDKSIAANITYVRHKIIEYYFKSQKDILSKLNLIVDYIYPIANYSDNNSVIIMPFVKNKTIGQILNEENYLASNNNINQTSVISQDLLINKLIISKNILMAINNLHKNNIILVDTNPYNFIYYSNKVYIIDFNCAIQKDENDEFIGGPLIGYHDLIAPEVLEQHEYKLQHTVNDNTYKFYKYTFASEVYTLGLLFKNKLFKLNFNNLPKQAKILIELEKLISKMLSINPSKRITVLDAINSFTAIINSIASEVDISKKV